MELAAFDPQLSDDQLKELGRMTVNFGYAELLLDWLLLAAFNVRNQEAIRALITPLSTTRKVELLEGQLDKCFDDEAASSSEMPCRSSKMRMAIETRSCTATGLSAAAAYSLISVRIPRRAG